MVGSGTRKVKPPETGLLLPVPTRPESTQKAENENCWPLFGLWTRSRKACARARRFARARRLLKPRSKPSSSPTRTSLTAAEGGASSVTGTCRNARSRPASDRSRCACREPGIVHSTGLEGPSSSASRCCPVPTADALAGTAPALAVPEGRLHRGLRGSLAHLAGTRRTRPVGQHDQPPEGRLGTGLRAMSSSDQSRKQFVCLVADGVYCQARLEEVRQCLLVLIGADEEGNKELVGLTDGYRESEQVSVRAGRESERIRGVEEVGKKVS